MMSALSRLAGVSAVAAGLVLAAGPAGPALASTAGSPWSPKWTLTRAVSPPKINMSPVAARLITRLQVPSGMRSVKTVSARVVSPRGARTVAHLHLASGTHRHGTWRGKLTLPEQSPAGRWQVTYVARSRSGLAATDPAKAHFTVTKRAYPPLAIWQGAHQPGHVVVGPGAPAVTVQGFWGGPGRVTDADVTITGPRNYLRTTRHMTRTAGDTRYALYTASVKLPRSAAPGTWKAKVSLGDNGTWRPGPSGTFTVKQTPAITLHVSTTLDRHVGGKITFTGRVSAYGAGGKWRPLAHAHICLWWKTTQPGDQWACDHRFRANRRGRFTDPEWPLHGAHYKAVVHAPGMAPGSSRILFVRVKGG